MNETTSLAFIIKKLLSAYFLKKIALCFCLSLMYAVGSQVIIPLPFNLVPMSLQPLPIHLATLIFGWPGAIACFFYLLQGVLGAPIFSGMGGGVVHLMGPTGGYLFGFAIAATFIAATRKIKPSSVVATFAKITIAHSIEFACGIAQLSFFVPFKTALVMGFYPFVVTDYGFMTLIMLSILHSIHPKNFFKKFFG